MRFGTRYAHYAVTKYSPFFKKGRDKASISLWALSKQDMGAVKYVLVFRGSSVKECLGEGR